MIQPATTSDRDARPSRRRPVVVVFVLLAASVALGYYLVRRAANARLAKAAREAVYARHFDEARQDISRWLASDPKAADAYYLLARVEIASEHAQEAINAMSHALDLGYPQEELAPYRAVILARANKFDEAEPLLLNALATSDEPRPEIAKALAQVYLGTFRLRQAVAPIKRWMRDAPDDPEPYLWLNEVVGRSDQEPAVVIQNYREALKRDPNLAKAHLGLADRLRTDHRLDEAADEYAAYLKFKPDGPDGHVGSGRVSLERGDLDEAAKFFHRALDLNPSEPVALKELGAIDLKQGRHQSAVDLLRKVIAIDPYDPETRYNLSLALKSVKDYAGSRAEDDAAQKLRRDHERMADLRTQIVARPNDLALKSEVAEWLLNHGHDEEGLTWTEQILHDHPNHESTLRLLIAYFERKKDPGKANYYRLLLRQSVPEPTRSTK